MALRLTLLVGVVLHGRRILAFGDLSHHTANRSRGTAVYCTQPPDGRALDLAGRIPTISRGNDTCQHVDGVPSESSE
jgi:hypothetical protein